MNPYLMLWIGAVTYYFLTLIPEKPGQHFPLWLAILVSVAVGFVCSVEIHSVKRWSASDNDKKIKR